MDTARRWLFANQGREALEETKPADAVTLTSSL